jgi:molybdopterin synthase sulfur carrier subunit
MKLKLLYFASLAEDLGRQEETLEIHNAAQLSDLRQHLAQRGENWATHILNAQRTLAAVNQTMARDDAELHDGDEIAFFPPVSGG